MASQKGSSQALSFCFGLRAKCLPSTADVSKSLLLTRLTKDPRSNLHFFFS